MLNGLKNKMNNIYMDDSIPLNSFKKRIVYMIKQRVTKADITTFSRLNRLKKRKSHTNRKIQVVFLLQMPEVWGKQKSIYYEMKRDERIHTVVLAIPKFDIQKQCCETGRNEAYDFAVSENLSEIVRADTNEGLVDLKNLNPDYVFYQRPYEAYLPKEYRSDHVIEYAKTCYVPYAIFATLEGEMIREYERGFARNIYINFVSSRDMENRLKKKFFLTSKLKLRKFRYLGIPILENILRCSSSEAGNRVWQEWGDSSNKLKILWTPRWTTDDKLGGSHFFQYNEEICRFALKNDDFFIVLRPHPLAFANYIREGLMTEKEVEAFKQKLERTSNMALDDRKEYIDTFWGADVLITDISSMLLEFFVTGKPVIFCGTDIKLNSLYSEVVDATYQCGSWNEIEMVLCELQNGEDRLKEKRQRLIETLFGDLENTSHRIVEEIANDYLQD
nr:CDP-glycerol glycerophosphotransferase family protein [uncultured Mediterraneibacter sp.]